MRSEDPVRVSSLSSAPLWIYLGFPVLFARFSLLSVHHAEDGGVGTDAESEYHDNRNGKSRRLAQLAQRSAKIAQQVFHGLSGVQCNRKGIRTSTAKWVRVQTFCFQSIRVDAARALIVRNRKNCPEADTCIRPLKCGKTRREPGCRTRVEKM